MTIFQGVILNGTEVINAPTIVGDTAFQTNNQTITFGQPLAAASTRLSQDTTRAQFLLGLGTALGNQFIIGVNAWIGHDYDHAAPADPTLFIHSATDPDVNNTQWFSVAAETTRSLLWSNHGQMVFYSPGAQIVSASEHYFESGFSVFAGNSLATNAYSLVRGITDDGLHWALGAGVNTSNYNFILTTQANVAKDHDHTPASTNPTLIVHSATDPDVNNTQWVSISHNATYGIITTGASYLEFSSPSGIIVDNAIIANGNVNLNGSGTILSHVYSGSNYGYIFFNTATATHMALGTGVTSTQHNLALVSINNYTLSYGHVSSTNPTLFIHSAVAPGTATNQWVSLTHDQTNAVITTGKGKLSLTGANGANGFVCIGSAASYAGLTANDDLVVSANLEVGAASFCKDTRYSNQGGITYGGVYPYTDDGMHLWASPTDGAANNNYILTSQSNMLKNHDHNPASANPTLWIHSNADPDGDNTQWLRLTHNQTYSIVEGGKGVLSLTAGSGVRVGTGSDASFAGISNYNDLLISGDMECPGQAYFKYPVFVDTTDSICGGIFAYEDDGVHLWVMSAHTTANNNYIITNDTNKLADHGHAGASDDPTLFIHSDTDVGTSTAQWISFRHDRTNGVIATGAGDLQLAPITGLTEVTGIGLKTKEYNQAINDHATFSLPAGAGWGFFTIGDSADYALFTWSSTGVVTGIAGSAGVSFSNAMGQFCFYDGGTTVTVKNDLGYNTTIQGVIHYK